MQYRANGDEINSDILGTFYLPTSRNDHRRTWPFLRSEAGMTKIRSLLQNLSSANFASSGLGTCQQMPSINDGHLQLMKGIPNVPYQFWLSKARLNNRW